MRRSPKGFSMSALDERIDRRGASAKRSSDVSGGDIPTLTHTAFDALARGDKSDQNLKMKRLAMGRVHMGRALLAIDGSLTDHRDSERIRAKLRGIRDKLEKLYADYPLLLK